MTTKKRKNKLMLKWRAFKEFNQEEAGVYTGYTRTWWLQMENGDKEVPLALTKLMECELKDNGS